MIFEAFPKIPRLFRDVTITEKLDGTNAQVWITSEFQGDRSTLPIVADFGETVILAGSRQRFITPDDDNFGFARWVREHAEELLGLGEGRHFGEWWGKGIQRGYGLDEKRLSLFNTKRWRCPHAEAFHIPNEKKFAPECCHVVPTLYSGPLCIATEFPHYAMAPDRAIALLETYGSHAAPGFKNPEGIIIYHHHADKCFKYTLDGDGHKG